MKILAYIFYVTDRICIKRVSKEIESQMRELGAYSGDDQNWYITFSSKQELVFYFDKIRNMNIAFSGGQDWSPADQFEDMREKGLISGSYAKIVWRNSKESDLIIS